MSNSAPQNIQEQQRRLAAVMFTDMVGYSALTQKDERLALALVEEQGKLLRPIFQKHDGTVIKNTGDGFLAEFSSALNAARCAIELQQKLVERNGGVAPSDRIHIRIGLHVGDVTHRDGDIFGDGVNIAARIEPLADTDGICISEDVARQVEGKIDYALHRVGRRELKNISAPVVVYKIEVPWSVARRRKVPKWPFVTAALVVLSFVLGFFLGTKWPLRRPAVMSHPRTVNGVSFSSDSRMLASASDDQTIRIWDTKTKTLIRTLSGHTRGVNAVAFSPDSSLVMSGGRDKTVRLWNAQTGQQSTVLNGHTTAVQSVAFSPDGRIAASGEDAGTILLWDVASGQQRSTLVGHNDAVDSLAFSHDGQVLASSSDDDTIRLWNVANARQLRVITGHRGPVNDVSFSPTNNWLASGSEDRTVRIWDASSGDEVQTIATDDVVYSVSFSPDGQFIAAATQNGIVQIWDVNTWQKTKEIKSSEGLTIYGLAWSGTGLLGWGDIDGEVTIQSAK